MAGRHRERGNGWIRWEGVVLGILGNREGGVMTGEGWEGIGL